LLDRDDDLSCKSLLTCAKIVAEVLGGICLAVVRASMVSLQPRACRDSQAAVLVVLCVAALAVCANVPAAQRTFVIRAVSCVMY